MYKVQSIKLVSTEFWSPYLVQIGAEIRVSVADVDTDSLLSQNWPPQYVSPSWELQKLLGNRFYNHGLKRTEKNGKNRTERYGISKFRSFRKSLATSIAQLEAQRGSADEDYRAFRQQLGVDGQQLATALQTLEGRVDQAARRKSISDSMHELKTEINRVEQEAIRARQVIDQRLQGFEDAGAWTTKDLTTEFGKWQAMHRESVRQVFEEQFASMEQSLAGMEKAVGELKGLQTQMADFQTSQNSVVQMLTRMESQIAKLDWVNVEADDDEEQVEEKDQEPGTSQSTGPPLEMCAERNGKKRERERNWKGTRSFLSRSYKF